MGRLDGVKGLAFRRRRRTAARYSSGRRPEDSRRRDHRWRRFGFDGLVRFEAHRESGRSGSAPCVRQGRRDAAPRAVNPSLASVQAPEEPCARALWQHTTRHRERLCGSSPVRAARSGGTLPQSLAAPQWATGTRLKQGHYAKTPEPPQRRLRSAGAVDRKDLTIYRRGLPRFNRRPHQSKQIHHPIETKDGTKAMAQPARARLPRRVETILTCRVEWLLPRT